MGKIELNLKAKEISLVDARNKIKNSAQPLTAHQVKNVPKFSGIERARKLCKMFKDSNLCPVVTRISFSKVVITY